MSPALILLVIVTATLRGDYLIKVASGDQSGLTSVRFVVGMLLYGLPAIGWFFLMRSHSLAALGVMYSVTTLLLMAALGTLVFKEAFGLRKAAGITLAIAAVVVMTYEA
jgi:multidrug transporter EmrE-like cation transporter